MDSVHVVSKVIKLLMLSLAIDDRRPGPEHHMRGKVEWPPVNFSVGTR